MTAIFSSLYHFLNILLHQLFKFIINLVYTTTIIMWWMAEIAIVDTVFARSVAAATNVFNLSRREATIQERLLFESGVYLFDCALPQELNDYVMVFVNV